MADTRNKQKNDQLYRCLKNSLTSSVTSKIIAETFKYYIWDNPCIMILFNLIIKKSIVDTKATTSNMWENLPNINTYISTVNSDVEKFKEYTKINYGALTTRG